MMWKEGDEDSTLPSTVWSINESKPKSQSATINSTGTNTRRRIMVVFLVTLLLVWILAIVVDLKAAQGRTQMSFEEVTLAVSRKIPQASSQVYFESGARWSRVKPQGARCTVEPYQGEIVMIAEMHTNTHFTLHATCSESDAEAHAKVLWHVLMEDDQKRRRSITQIACNIDVHVTVGYLFPYSHTQMIAIDLDDSTRNGNGKNGNIKPSIKTENEHEGIKPSSIPPIMVRHVTAETLELDVRLDSGDWMSKDNKLWKIVLQLTVILPAMTTTAAPRPGASSLPLDATAILSTDALHATFVQPKDEDEEKGSVNTMAVHLSCEPTLTDSATVLSCPWFRPLGDLLTLRGSTEPTIVDVIIDSNGSFIEMLIGRTHTLTIQPFHQELAMTPVIHHEDHLGLRHRRLFQKNFSSSSWSAVAADCLRIDDDSQSLEFGFCLLVDTSQEFFLAVSNMTFYDTHLSGMANTQWHREEGTRTIYMGSHAVLDTQDKRRINVTSDARIDYYKTDVELDMTIINDGSWLPFNGTVSMNGTVQDEVLDMTLHEATLMVDGDVYLMQAIGELLVDVDELTLMAFLQDPELQILVQGEIITDDDSDTLTGSTSGRYKGDEKWNATIMAGVFYDDVNGNLFKMELNEPITDTAMAARAVTRDVIEYFPETDEEVDYLKLVIDSFTIRQSDRQIVNAMGNVTIDIANEVAVIQIEDSARADFLGDITASWSTETNIINGEENEYVRGSIDKFVVTNYEGSKLYLEIVNATFQDDNGVGSINFTSHPDALLQLVATIHYAWAENDDFDEYFVADFVQLLIGWHEDTWSSAYGRAFLDFDNEMAGIYLFDTTEADFSATFSSGWYSESDDEWGFSMDEMMVDFGSEIQLNSRASFDFRRIDTNVFDDKDAIGMLKIVSDSNANLEMAMGMNFTWFSEEEVFQMAVEECRMAWKDTLYMEVGRHS